MRIEQLFARADGTISRASLIRSELIRPVSDGAGAKRLNGMHFCHISALILEVYISPPDFRKLRLRSRAAEYFVRMPHPENARSATAFVRNGDRPYPRCNFPEANSGASLRMAGDRPR